MSEWITDRLPTVADSDVMCKVWVFALNTVYLLDYSVVTLGTPWMPIKEPAPYVKPEPKQWKPENDQRYHYVNEWGDTDDVLNTHHAIDIKQYEYGNCFQTEAQAQEAARRIHELLLNYHKELLNGQMDNG